LSSNNFLNGLQLRLALFLLAAGLTLVFGIMDFVNLAHGSLYMMGAYFAATFVMWTGNFVIGVMLALARRCCSHRAGIRSAAALLRPRSSDHVLATFGLILFFNDAVRLIWGPAGLALPLPAWLTVPIQIMPGSVLSELSPGDHRRLAPGRGLFYMVVMRTRLGMLIRAGASNRRK